MGIAQGDGTHIEYPTSWFDSNSPDHIIKHIIKMDKPTKTVRVSAGTRIYYFDAHKDKKGQPYISVSEIPVSRSPGKKERQRIFIHTEDIDKFISAFAEVANHIKSSHGY